MFHAEGLAARIVANVAVWGFLGFGMSFLVAFRDWTLGFAMGWLTLCELQFFLVSGIGYDLRVWATSEETPGSATMGIYLCTRLQECPIWFHMLSRVARPPYLLWWQT